MGMAVRKSRRFDAEELMEHLKFCITETCHKSTYGSYIPMSCVYDAMKYLHYIFTSNLNETKIKDAFCKCGIYIFSSKNEIDYVGMSSGGLIARVTAQIRKHSPISVFTLEINRRNYEYDTLVTRILEKCLIAVFKPRNNVIHTNNGICKYLDETVALEIKRAVLIRKH